MIDFSILASSAPELTNIIGKFINLLYEWIGNFGWTVVVFTIIFKLCLSPIDVWQKVSQRKQSKMMARLQPQLAKIQKQYANRPDILKQKQAELYRGEKMGMLGMCLPLIITMAVFFVVLGGFNAMVKYQNEVLVYNIAEAYIASGKTLTPDQLAALYQPEGWLWIQNIFMPDNWANVIPGVKEYLGTGMGAIGGSVPDIANFDNWYETLIGPAMAVYNKTSFWDIKNWNGYMILPLLSIVTSILSAKFMQASAPPVVGDAAKQKQSQTTQKVMMYIMPLTFGIFSLFYSAAFAIYVFVSSLISTLLGFGFNFFTKRKDKKNSEIEATTMYKR